MFVESEIKREGKVGRTAKMALFRIWAETRFEASARRADLD